jgi:hypothetical protein
MSARSRYASAFAVAPGRPLAARLVVVALVAAASVPVATGSAASPPSVQSMIVGSTGAILSPARTVTASATSVDVRGHSCSVTAGTPLAVLAAVQRAGGPGFAVRDYGHCGASPASSAQLFVYSLAGEANSGQDGWEYKVDSVSGSTGAGDPSGSLGDGRLLSSGERVLWFWCDASRGGCQRTLQARPSAASVSPGAFVTVTVSGYDNEGRGAPVGGAIVTLGSDFASTAADGQARLVAPVAPGRYAVDATRRGLVPSFPETIVVR